MKNDSETHHGRGAYSKLYMMTYARQWHRETKLSVEPKLTFHNKRALTVPIYREEAAASE